MSDTRFIKTVSFGGYDREDVDARLEAMYSQVFELKNELREVKLLCEEYKKGTEAEKAADTVLAGERAMLTAAQVQKETLSDKLKAADDDIKSKDEQIAALTAELAEVKAKLEDTESKLELQSAGSDASALGAAIIGAQAAANAVKKEAEAKAADIENNAKKLCDNMIDDANNKAAQIIYDAEKQAALIEAEAKTAEERISVAQGNLKSVLMVDADEYLAQLIKLRTGLEELEKTAVAKIKDSESLLHKTKETLNAGGVPVFKHPSEAKVELPELPKLKPVDNTYPTPETDKAREEIKAQKDAEAKAKEEKKKEEAKPKAAKKGPSLADLAKKASSMADEDED